MNYQGIYNVSQFIELIRFTFILMILNMLFVMPGTRNMYRWQNILLCIIFLGMYLFYYFNNNYFLYEMDRLASFEVFSLYPYILFISFVMSFWVGGNFFYMLDKFGYWNKKSNEQFIKENSEVEVGRKVKR